MKCILCLEEVNKLHGLITYEHYTESSCGFWLRTLYPFKHIRIGYVAPLAFYEGEIALDSVIYLSYESFDWQGVNNSRLYTR